VVLTGVIPVLTFVCLLVILAVFAWSETWFVTLREEHRLSMFENRVLRKLFGLQINEITGTWRELHSEKILKLYSSLNVI
jgi:hypothetical protein